MSSIKSTAYKIIVSPRAQKEIEHAIDYYAIYSDNAPLNFVSMLKEGYEKLSENPFLGIRYKNVRSLKIKRFPYSLFFTINEENNSVRILSCFHNKLSPNRRP